MPCHGGHDQFAFKRAGRTYFCDEIYVRTQVYFGTAKGEIYTDTVQTIAALQFPTNHIPLRASSLL